MGLLFMGKPLAWEDSIPYLEYIREHGITQFLYLWDRFKDREGDTLLWGDEVEYMLLSFDAEAKNAKLSLHQTEILANLQSLATDICSHTRGDPTSVPTFHPESGSYMLEGTPGSPYTGSVLDLLSVERNMRNRRKLVRAELMAHEAVVTITSFPRLGSPGVFTDPYYDPSHAQSSHSLFLPDEITSAHVRFPTLMANIRRRRGSKVAINVPIFFDVNTPRPFVDPTIPYDRRIFPEDPEAMNGAALPDHIYLDATEFGMGCSCLQITFQACNVDEARRAYDALVPVGPIMLALTAASPAYRGYLADVDCRWSVIAASTDDRTEEERGLKPLRHNKHVIPKSRYDSVDLYISKDLKNRPEYNDIFVPYDEDIYKRLTTHGIDTLLSKHVAHLFIRDPLAVFSDRIELDDIACSDHFESIQSTNWQTLRFKISPPKSPIGWRVEFRSMEVQITDFENAAFSVFILLLSRAILSFGLNFYVPISKVDENMQRAQQRGAATQQKFFFRKRIYPAEPRHSTPSEVPAPSERSSATINSLNIHGPFADISNGIETNGHGDGKYVNGHEERGDKYEEMTMAEIINGKGNEFPGLLGVVNAYLNSLNMEFESKQRMRAYMALVKRRADGSLKTCATWIREFIRSHPAYKHDSVISEEINFDLMKALDEIERGMRVAHDLLPTDYVGSKIDDGCL
ncbi:hypothetical protein BS47DRAFT_1290533 [Hydnum rufescens UP504]|uniref:Glutamate--cysteine ligase n=1 Tax=Hydnum rufescens UP504 TaxID=1448309 RepID=A0A9P6E0X5_9AGAM|nr:hypothetical protein BS47DRAFT_1290533 [Hydnum rufescens UP504]